MTSVADTAFDENGAQIGVVFETATPFDTPNWQPWLVFFLRSLAEQVRRLNQKIEREKLVLAPLPELSLQVVEFAREHGRVTMGDVIRLTGASRNTLKQHFRALVEQGRLSRLGSGRGAWYTLR
jgi:predicted HTH transcriptional regulator